VTASLVHVAGECPARPRNTRYWIKALAPYREPSLARSLVELAVTAVPFLTLWGLMWLCLRHVGYGLCLLLAVPAAGLVVRLFMIQHDCGHGSFFRRRWANDWLGRAIGVLTLTAYGHWRHRHAVHHATSGNLDQRGVGDVHTLTVAEFRGLPAWRRLVYRLTRSPLTVLGVGPIYIFVLKHRLPSAPLSADRAAWRSVMATNLAIAGVVAAMAALLGWRDFLLVQAPITWLASTIGVWLFFVQHQFEGTSWERDGNWTFHDGALAGSSHLDLPPVLRWFSANIGVHHVHHLAARIPSYRLGEVLRDHPELRGVNRLTLRQSLQGFGLALWDEEGRRLVSFREARRLAGAPRQGERHACAPIGGLAGGSFAARTASAAGA
jgi:omega-6 fatty acid desaturase (delta-12 desaturase)